MAIRTESATTANTLKRKPVAKPSNALSANKIITVRIFKAQATFH
jgi:hypothetical protein